MSARLAFVVQRCGREVTGGSETLCLQVARRLVAGGRAVDVLTTCAVDYVTWANHYAPGDEVLDGVRIRRFPVAGERDPERFARHCAHVRRNKWRLTGQEQRDWVQEQGPWSPALLSYLAAHAADYEAFFFFTYLYATTFFGLPLVAERAILVPAAHDEWPLQLGIYDELFALPAAHLFLTFEERALLRRRFPLHGLDGPIAGIGVTPPAAPSPAAFVNTYDVRDPYLFYVGRVEPAKGVLELTDCFDRYRRDSGDVATRLVFAGPPLVELPPVGAVRCLGVLPEEQKWNALAGAIALVLPSRFESLSVVCLEAWSVGTPTLVCAEAAVLMGQTARSGGGLWYADAVGFRLAVERLRRDPALRGRLGAAGRRYVERHCGWQRVVDAYVGLVAAIRSSRLRAAAD